MIIAISTNNIMTFWCALVQQQLKHHTVSFQNFMFVFAA